MTFNPGADPYTISLGGLSQTVEFTDFGIINNSASAQTLQTDELYGSSFFKFLHNSRAGINVTYLNQPTYPLAGRNYIEFFDSTSADYATFISPSPFPTFEGESGDYHFFGQSSAGHAVFILEEADFSGGHIGFYDYSTGDHGNFTVGRNCDIVFAGTGGTHGPVTAANATFHVLPKKYWDLGADVAFFDNSTAADATFTLDGGAESGGSGGNAHFFGKGMAGNAQFTIKGATRGQAEGGSVTFVDTATADHAKLTANGGTAGNPGGAIYFYGDSIGEMSSMILNDNGKLDISSHSASGVSVGSIAGNGLIYLGAWPLSLGANGLDQTFAGVIQDGGYNGGTGGSVIKVGAAKLTLTGASIYTGGTIVNAGTLLIANTTGSGTGTGDVQVNAGTLGGSGIISGAVTVGTGSGSGASLAPAAGTGTATTLSIQQALTFKADANLSYTFKAKKKQAKADKVIAGGVTIQSGASFVLSGTTQGSLSPGLVLTVIRNIATTPIGGTFSNLPDGAIVSVNGNNLQASYEGGDGNDLTLTVVP